MVIAFVLSLANERMSALYESALYSAMFIVPLMLVSIVIVYFVKKKYASMSMEEDIIGDQANSIRSLKQMRDHGQLTEEEYQLAKEKVAQRIKSKEAEAAAAEVDDFTRIKERRLADEAKDALDLPEAEGEEVTLDSNASESEALQEGEVNQDEEK